MQYCHLLQYQISLRTENIQNKQQIKIYDDGRKRGEEELLTRILPPPGIKVIGLLIIQFPPCKSIITPPKSFTPVTNSRPFCNSKASSTAFRMASLLSSIPVGSAPYSSLKYNTLPFYLITIPIQRKTLKKHYHRMFHLKISSSTQIM